MKTHSPGGEVCNTEGIALTSPLEGCREVSRDIWGLPVPKNCSPSALCQEICQKIRRWKTGQAAWLCSWSLGRNGNAKSRGEKVSASHETLCPTKKSCSEDALRMDLSVVRGINNAGSVGKASQGEFSLHPSSFPHGKLEPECLERLQTHGHN